jgi:hypothetical protein
MPRNVQCPQCSTPLNLPDQAIGKRLRCPKCATKFAMNLDDAGSPSSTYLLPSTNPASSQEMKSFRRSSDEEAIPTAPGDLRETFDLPMLGEAGTASGLSPSSSKQAGDAMALFVEDPRREKRRPSAAEARSRARRCPTCSGVVPMGMSICSRCGLDLESGTRVDLEDDLAPPPPPAPTMPLAIGILGGVCFLASLIFTIATLSLWIRGSDGFQYFVPLCLFGVFASVQFLRRKSARLLLVALTFGLAIDIVALIALPIYHANSETSAVQRSEPVDDFDQADVVIPSVVDRLDTQSLTLGIGLIVVYAGVAVYLLSPQVRRYFRTG